MEDEEAGVHRAYFTDIMDGYPCHQDLQVSDGEALLLQYVTKYCSKFSDSNHQEWLNDDADANAVARRVCYECHPYEPEMLLTLLPPHPHTDTNPHTPHTPSHTPTSPSPTLFTPLPPVGTTFCTFGPFWTDF